MDVPGESRRDVLGRTASRRQVLRVAGVVAAATPLLAPSRSAAAVDFGTVLWQPITIGTPIAGLAFRVGTGGDNLNGPTDLLAASAVIASVVVRTASGQATVTRQLNDPDEGWP